MSVESSPEDRIVMLERVDRRIQELNDEIEAIGRENVKLVAEAHDDATSLLDGYQGAASGTGADEFKAFVKFQEQFTTLVEDLPADLPRRERFEKALEAVDKRRLSQSDFQRARRSLEPVAEIADLRSDLSSARDQYRDARSAVVERRRSLEDEIEDLERLQSLGRADLSAPTERLREPITDYDETVLGAFDDFRRSAPARAVIHLIVDTSVFPLVEFEQPPPDLLDAVRNSEVGAEPIPTLLEYADYSRSKLRHYVDEPAKLKRHVATNRTYLDQLDGEPLTVGWPPPPPDGLRFFLREAIQVCGRFADEKVVATARSLRELPDTLDYERLRDAAIAEDRLDEDERRRLSSGAVERDLDRLRAERDRVVETLDTYPRR